MEKEPAMRKWIISVCPEPSENSIHFPTRDISSMVVPVRDRENCSIDNGSTVRCQLI